LKESKNDTILFQELESSAFEKTKLKTEIEILKQKLAEYEPITSD